MVCTVYSHSVGFEKVIEIIKNTVPSVSLTISKTDVSEIALFEFKGGLFSPSKKLTITYRQRTLPSYRIPEIDDSPLTANLKGLYGYVNSLPCKNQQIKELFLQKIQTLNSEFSINQENGEIKELKSIIQNLANGLDAVIFVQPNTIISRSPGQHFLDSNFDLIIDQQGNCEVSKLNVTIDSRYFDEEQDELTQDQVTRKSFSEVVLELAKIQINHHLPCVAPESAVVLRTPVEIANRVTILAVTNLVAFNSISGEQAYGFLERHGLMEHVTVKEKEFLSDPTDERKSNETWKCEGIWTLLWALNKVEDLGFPNQLCNLGNVNPENYPIAQNKNPQDFIHSNHQPRTASEILDENDLYYRLDWACVNARIKGENMNTVHPGVVWERHYALNWLINYRGQEWDDVSCDT